MIKKISLSVIISLLISIAATGQKLIYIGEGWADNSVNTTVFRKNSLVTHNDIQFTAYYGSDGYMILGKRKLNSNNWELLKTRYKGNVNDAHNSISIMVDGDGCLHVSWDHHGHSLRYAKGTEPLSLNLGDMQPMTGKQEANVTYPEFFRMPDGDLIFMYRDGQSGKGNLVINHYDLKTKKWMQKQSNLIDGENRRNAYWQACTDSKGIIHVSWVWRETWDVSTNHDLCYARSADYGTTWEYSDGNKYVLPVTLNNAEYICKIPQDSELINQTSMTVDDSGNPYIATYWREKDSEIPQYHVVYFENRQWKNINLNFRNTPFTLKGGGTKRIPISRPQIIACRNKKGTVLYLLFRDAERDEKVSLAICENLNNYWQIKDLTGFSVGSWEPSYDTELWRKKRKLHLFIQRTEQVDGEGKADISPQPVYVMEVSLPE